MQCGQFVLDDEKQWHKSMSKLAMVRSVRVITIAKNLIQQKSSRLKQHSNFNYHVIKDVHPFLFLRQDFLKHYIHNSQGIIATCHSMHDNSYRLNISSDGILTLKLKEEQYHRCGITTSIKHKSHITGRTSYTINLDLKNKKMLLPDMKYYQSILSALKRLPILKAIVIRQIDIIKQNVDCIGNFFRSVIDEYNQDGCLPRPLSQCDTYESEVHDSILNRMQPHPNINLTLHDEISNEILDVIDWIGYQLHSLDCSKEEISESYIENDFVDVSCDHLSGYFTPYDTWYLLREELKLPLNVDMKIVIFQCDKLLFFLTSSTSLSLRCISWEENKEELVD